jgi:hypothetical protein
MADTNDGATDAVRAAVDRHTALQLNRVQKALRLFCNEHLPPRFGVVIAHQLPCRARRRLPASRNSFDQL